MIVTLTNDIWLSLTSSERVSSLLFINITYMFTSIVLSLILALIGTHSFNEVSHNTQLLNQSTDSVTQIIQKSTVKAELDLSPGSPVIKRALIGFSYGLQHPVEGVVESAIYQVMVLSLRAPDVDLTKLKTQLKDLSTSHEMASIRVRAFLALEFLSNDSYRAQVKHFVHLNQDQEEAVDIFKNISTRLTDQALKGSR
jgi:hypothetical protein